MKKKYPQPVDTYVGLITPNGVVYSDKKKVALSNIEVREYGFSKAVQELCPAEWKRPLGKDWEDVLSIILLQLSSESYLRDRAGMKKEEDFHYQFAAQVASLSRHIKKIWYRSERPGNDEDDLSGTNREKYRNICHQSKAAGTD